MTDPIFGEIEYEFLWHGKHSIPGFSDAVAIEIDADGSPPAVSQQEAFQWYLARARELRVAMQAALYRYAMELRHHWAQTGEVDMYGGTPPIRDEADIWNHVSSPSIYIPIQHSSSRRCAFGFNCDWDREHGVQVVFEDSTIVTVGEIGTLD